jgi:DDE superfamily endonuclease
LETLEALQDQDWIDVFFFDESGFSLTSCLPYAWQQKGQTIGLYPGKGSRINVAGFYCCSGDFVFQMQPQSFCQHHLIEIFDNFCGQIKKKTIVVLDNAPAHHGKAFEQKVQQWQEQDLYLFYLPAYSPELNKIEIIWRKIKYQWLAFDAYLDFKNLNLKLEEVLKNIGVIYTVNFG